MKAQTFREGMDELAKAFNMNLTPEQIKIWYKYTKDLTDKQFNSKIENCILNCKHKPYIADLLNLESGENRPGIEYI